MKLYYFQGTDRLIEYPEGIISMRACKVKPFPTCKTCKKWKDIVACEGSCVIITPNGNTIRDVETRPDFFCAGHPDFDPDFGGNNGKDDPIQEDNKEQK